MSLKRLSKVLPNAGRAWELVRCARVCRNWIPIAAGYLGLRDLTYPCALQLRDDAALTLESFEDLATAWLVFIRRDYNVDPTCRTIIDAGANIGTFSLFAAHSAPGTRVIALEPYPSTFGRLEGTVKASRSADRITCRRAALGRSNGKRLMSESPMASQFRKLADPNDCPVQSGIAVESITLATLWEREGLDHVDLLKLDVEGAEHELLQSTPAEVLGRIDTIAMEYHPGGSKADLFRRLCEVGFALVRDEPAREGYGVALFRHA